MLTTGDRQRITKEMVGRRVDELDLSGYKVHVRSPGDTGVVMKSDYQENRLVLVVDNNRKITHAKLG